MSNFKFNATNVPPQQPMDVLPPGDYLGEVVETTVGPTKENTGTKLDVTIKVIAPQQYKGRKIFDTFNVQNQSAEAERIGQSQLSALQHAINRLDINQTEELHGIPFCVGVKIEKGDKNYPNDRNRTTGYKTADKYVDRGGPATPFGGIGFDNTGGQQVAGQQPARPASPGDAAAAWSQQNGAGAAATPPPAPTPPAPPPPPPAPAQMPAAPVWASWQKSPDGAWALNPTSNAWEEVKLLMAQQPAQQSQAGEIKGPWNQ